MLEENTVFHTILTVSFVAERFWPYISNGHLKFNIWKNSWLFIILNKLFSHLLYLTKWYTIFQLLWQILWNHLWFFLSCMQHCNRLANPVSAIFKRFLNLTISHQLYLLLPWSKTKKFKYMSFVFSRGVHHFSSSCLESWWNDINHISRQWVHGLFSTTNVT